MVHYSRISPILPFKADYTESMSALHHILTETPISQQLLYVLPPFTEKQLKEGLRTSWTAEQIGRLAVKYESEWYADESLSKWNEIDDFYEKERQAKQKAIQKELEDKKNSKPAAVEYAQEALTAILKFHINEWNIEKNQRIKPSLWWNEVVTAQQAQTESTTAPVLSTLPADGKVWHLHPVGMITLSIIKERPIIKLDNKEYELPFLYKRENMNIILDVEYETLANELGCEAKALKAVGIKETKDDSYYTNLGDHVPKILFERHYFHNLTNGLYDNDISHSSAFSRYGTYAQQYKRLLKAYELSPHEALLSASWGKFQIMGSLMDSNTLSIEDILYKISISEQNHLETLKGYLLKNSKALDALKEKDWSKFALYYNGKYYKKNNYDTKIKEIYDNL